MTSRPSSSLALPPELILRSMNNLLPGSQAAPSYTYPTTPIQGGPTSFVPSTSYTSQYSPSSGGTNGNLSYQPPLSTLQYRAPQYSSIQNGHTQAAPNQQAPSNHSTQSGGQQYQQYQPQQQTSFGNPVSLDVKTPINHVLQQLHSHAPANFIPGKQHAQHMTNLLAAAIPSQQLSSTAPPGSGRPLAQVAPKKSDLRLPKSVEDYYQTDGPCLTSQGTFQHVVDIAQSTILGNTPPSAATSQLFESIDLDVTDLSDIDPIFFRIAQFVGGCRDFRDDKRYFQEPRGGIMLIPKVPRDANGKPLVGNFPYSKLAKLHPNDPEIARRKAITMEIAPYKKFAGSGGIMPNIQAAAPPFLPQPPQQQPYQQGHQSYQQGQQTHQQDQQSYQQVQQSHQQQQQQSNQQQQQPYQQQQVYQQQQPSASFVPSPQASNAQAIPTSPTVAPTAPIPEWKQETMSGSGDSDDETDSSDDSSSESSVSSDEESGEETDEEQEEESSVEEISTKQLAKRGTAVAKKPSYTPPKDRFGLGLFETDFETSTIAMMEQQEIKRRKNKLDEYVTLVKTAQHIDSDYIKPSEFVEQLDVEELTQLVKDLQDDYDFETNVWETVSTIVGKWAPCSVAYTNSLATNFLDLEDPASDEEQDMDEEEDNNRPIKKKRGGKYVQSMQEEVKKLKQDTKLKWLKNNRSFDWSSIFTFGVKLTTGTVNRHLSRTYNFELDQPISKAGTGFGTSVAAGLVSDSSLTKTAQVPAKKRYKEDPYKIAKEARRQEKEARRREKEAKRAARQPTSSANNSQLPSATNPPPSATVAPPSQDSKPATIASNTRQLLDANVASSSAPAPAPKEASYVPQQRTRVSLGDPKVMNRLNNFQ